MWGEGQMIAHLQALPQHLPHLKAGLMLREKFNERDSKMAFFILRRWMAVVLPCGGGKAMK
jgi:hypothetical protein